MSQLRYMPSLDGLRFLSFLFVFFYHAGSFAKELQAPQPLLTLLRPFTIGWIGVDVFFVLSGFLITAGLLQDLRHEHLLRRFYWKRSLRIFPLYYAACLAGFVALPLLFPARRDEWSGLLSHWPLYVIHLQNWWSSFSAESAQHLSHFWSLAIEEQFYLLWPLSLLALSRTRYRFAICVVVVGLVLAGRIAVMALWGPDASDYLHLATTSRIDSLLVGCLLAFATADGGWLTSINRTLSFSTAAIAIAAAYLVTFWPTNPLDHWPTQMVGYTVIAVGAAGLVALLHRPECDGTLLANRSLVYLGRISYGLYVVHWPVLYFARTGFEQRHLVGPIWGIAFPVVTLGVTIAVAAVSYQLYERPFLKLKARAASAQGQTAVSLGRLSVDRPAADLGSRL